ncbi:hypothetical protein [[Mycoplasma] testudinis]|uniref:hypothetical protein n=1 Tax=[Mycoplasma] testudinis TaxID=33924 RepID=UPI000485ACD2|nr:hypothetical protein [[Mycoplasma] testudinis]
MLLINENLNKWTTGILKANVINRPVGLLDQLLDNPKPITIVNGISNTGLNQLCAQLICVAKEDKTVALFNCVSEEINQQQFHFAELIRYLQQNNNAIIFINEVQNLLSTKVLLRQIKQLAKKYQANFFLFFNQIGLLYSKFFERHDCANYYVEPINFYEWLASDVKKTSNETTFSNYLNTNGSLAVLPKTPNFLAERLASMVEQVMRHDVYELHLKKYSVHTCLRLLRLMAYASMPVFNLVDLAEHLELDILDLHQIIRILSTAKIIRSFPVYSKDLKRVSTNQLYLVFYDPINYGAFEGVDLGGETIQQTLKLWISALGMIYRPFGKLVVLKDDYVPYNEQVSLFDLEKQSLLQLGLGNDSIGPMLVYLQNKDIKKTYYINFQRFLNLLVNWSQKTSIVTKLH